MRVILHLTMNTQIYSDAVYVSGSHIAGAGRGVFARRPIKKGETIERCPTIELPLHDTEHVHKTDLINYIYYLGDNKNQPVIALGYGSIYNHSEHPNAMYRDLLEHKTLDFIALRDINKDEEITVAYNQGKQKDTSPLWFMVK